MGVGTQDDMAYARRFVEDTGTSFTMLWSDSFDAWDYFGVNWNSSVLLLDRAGRLLDPDQSLFDAATVSEKLDKLT